MKKETFFPISFEFFPPKTKESMENFILESKKLAQLNPDFFSVTYGAGGSTCDGTISTIEILQKNTAIPVAPHLSCIGATREKLITVLKTYQSLGTKRIIALRGDLPSGMGQTGELKHANELVSLIREVTQDYFHIEVAAYPEYHPQAKNAETDILNLKKKIEAGANSAITQYFYNADAYFYFLNACRRENISIPIVPGILPITSFNQLTRFSGLCGAEIPKWIYKRLEGYGDDVQSIKAFGLEVVYNLCERLLAEGVPGFHFYTLNHAEPTCHLLKLLKPLSHSELREKEKINEK